MGGCSKALKFVITIITWWVGVTKKWNCPLLFVTNLWCWQFFCKNVTSQLLKSKKKGLFVFSTKGNCQRLVDFGQLWNKKMFHCLAQQPCFLDKKKKNFWPRLFVFCFLHFGTLKKTKQKSAVFFSKGKCSFIISRSFVNKGFVFVFLFVNQTSYHLLFQQEVFRKVLFVFWTKYIWHKSFRKKQLVFFPLAKLKTEDFVV